MAIRALVMGFGGTGAHILTYVKEQAVLKYGAKLDTVRFLLFDTIADWRPGATVRIAGGAGEETVARGTETSLDPNREYFFLRDREPDLRQYVYELLAPGGHPERHPHLKDWLHTPWLRDNVERAQMEIVVGAAQQRQIGRFAMFQNAKKVVDQIRNEIRELAKGAQGSPVNVWIVGSSAGGTGAGCLLDAAHLTRIAVAEQKVSVTGVIVLPEVYEDKPGISQARAYGLFRELDRFQQQGIPDRDRYLFDGGRLTMSNVLYDDRKVLRSIVPNKLFDNLFYVGSACRSDDQRTAFFTSVASAIDPFLDENSGPPLLEKSVNLDAAASAFGAARLYVPKESLAELFAWQQVDRYLRSACAFVEEDGRRRLAAGPAQERAAGALKKVKTLSPLFEKILDLDGVDETFRKFARTLQPKQIVEDWYGMAAPEVMGLELRPEEKVDIKLTYSAPAYSWKESDWDRVPVAERTTRTFSEYKASAKALGLPSEDREASRDRFAQELDAVMKVFKDQEGSERSFEKGRRTLLARLSQHLRNKVDTLVTQTMKQSSAFAIDEAAPHLGTALTRLHQELEQMLADDGPFRKIDQRIGLFIEVLAKEEEQRQHEAIQAIGDLREWKSRFFSSPEDVQVAARESVSVYLTVYQRDRLLSDLQNLVREVQKRVEQWEQRIRSTFDLLVIDPGASCRADTGAQIRRLEARLARLAKNPKARISADPDWSPNNPGDDMLGFRQVLAEKCVVGTDGNSLAAKVLRSSEWRLDLDGKGRPTLALRWQLEGQETQRGENDLAQAHRDLYQVFRATIDKELENTDIFDYLIWVEREKGISAAQLAHVLNQAAEPLINAQGPEVCHLAVRTPGHKDKERWISSISEALRGVIGTAGLERVPHSDADSINVFRIIKPRNLDDFVNVVACQKNYVAWQQEMLPDDDAKRRELRRAQVYHPFRPELEAWYIERRAQQLRGLNFDHEGHLSPRLTRLLEDPAMMQAFVECVATGAVEKIDGDWIWHVTEKENLPLTVDGSDDDLFRAAVVFVLQQREGREQGLRRIELEAARRSADAKAKARGTSVAQAYAAFIESGLEEHLRGLKPPEHGDARRDQEGWRMLFEFYGLRTSRTTLDRRLDLKHTAI